MGYRPLQLDFNSLCPSQPENVFFFANPVRTIGSWTAGNSTYLSSISVTVHRPPSIEMKQCDCVVGKALPMIDIGQEDGDKGLEHIWW